MPDEDAVPPTPPSPLTRRRLLGAALILCGLGAVGAVAVPPLLRRVSGLPDPADPRTSLRDVEEAVARLWPTERITPAALDARRGDPGLVILDTRTPQEYDLAHIPGARRVDPAAPPEAVLAAIGSGAQGRTVVVYCSVGVRSSILARRSLDALAAAGVRQVVNLDGGLFRWSVERRAMTDGGGQPVSEIHPYDAAWGDLLRRSR